MNCLALAKRRKSPASATIVTAVRKPIPRSACSAAIVRTWGLVTACTSRATSRRRTRSTAAADHCGVVVEDHLIGGLLELEAIEPALVPRRPGPNADRWVLPVAKQELAPPVLGPQGVYLGIGTGPDQIA